MKRWVGLMSVGVLGLAAACSGDVERAPGAAGAGATGGASGSSGSAGKGGSTGGSAGNCTLSCELEPGPSGAALCECRRVTPECSSDIDCTLATNFGTCCPGCAWGFPSRTVEREPCLVTPGRIVPASCPPAQCNDGCPPVDCAPAARAVCRSGRCEGSYECLPDQVMSLNQCVRKCASDLDCVLARDTRGCCPTCPAVYPRSQVEAYDCLTPVNLPVPERCRPPPQNCALVDCTSPGNCPPLAPRCLADGSCGG